MKNKKGFTLIELLAVIVILAIIALIAVPIILNMINNARKSAAVDAAYGYVEAIEYNAGLSDIGTDSYKDFNLPDGTYTVAQISSKNIKLKGKKPTKGNVTLATRKVSHARLAIDGYWVEYNGKEAEVTGKYTPGKVTITFKNGETTVETKQVNEGSTIGSFPNINLQSNEELKGWYTETTFTNKVEISTQVNDDIIVYAKIDSPCSNFATASWSTIVSNLEADSNYYSATANCTKEVEIDMNNDGTNESYTVRLANTSKSNVCNIKDENGNYTYSQTGCGFVIEFVDVLITFGNYSKMRDYMNNSGGWAGSIIRDYLNQTVYFKLPTDLQNIIQTTKVISGYGSTGTTNFETQDRLYLLSPIEIGLSGSDTAEDKSIKLDYYDEGTGATAKAKRLKYNYKTSVATAWRLRNATSNNGNSFGNINSGGEYTNLLADTYGGVAPAFRIGTNS